MVSNTSSMSGIAYPSDLALLKQVFDRVCAEQVSPLVACRRSA